MEKHKTAFFSPSENRCLPASTLKPEEREFVVDSGASVHMISTKDLNDGEMDTLTKSCSPVIVKTANGEVQTHEEATVCVKELDIFLTMGVLGGTPAVLSLGKLCDENGCSYEWINGQKPHLIENGIRIQCNTDNFVPVVVPGLSASSSSGSDQSTSRTLSRQESDHPTSSSSSSTSPTTTLSSDRETQTREDLSGMDSMTPLRQERHCSTSSSSSSLSPTTATLSDSETREREDQNESDTSPVPVSSFNVADLRRLLQVKQIAIMFPGLSTSSSSSSPTSTSMTPSRQEIDHPKSSSSSSTSPPMTSSTVSSDRVERPERGDPCSFET